MSKSCSILLLETISTELMKTIRAFDGGFVANARKAQLNSTKLFNNAKIQTHALGSICVRRDGI